MSIVSATLCGVRLTKRETEVLGCLMSGLKNEETAKALKIAKRTVKAHKNRLYMKFRISSKWVKEVRLVYLVYAEWHELQSGVK